NTILAGDAYRIDRIYEIATTSVALLGLEENSLSGRELTVTAGTNSGTTLRIARNYEFGGTAYIIMSARFEQPCDNTSVFNISSSGLLFQDTSKTWTPNVWRGHVLTVGGQEFFIKTNTSDTLTVTPVYIN